MLDVGKLWAIWWLVVLKIGAIGLVGLVCLVGSWSVRGSNWKLRNKRKENKIKEKIKHRPGRSTPEPRQATRAPLLTSSHVLWLVLICLHAYMFTAICVLVAGGWWLVLNLHVNGGLFSFLFSGLATSYYRLSHTNVSHHHHHHHHPSLTIISYQLIPVLSESITTINNTNNILI